VGKAGVVTGPLPSLLVVTDGQRTLGRPLVEVVTAAVEGGARAVLLREKHLSRLERTELARRLEAVLHPVGGILVVASDATIRAGGVHLAAPDPFPEPGSRTDGGRLVGRSCHHRVDVQQAATEGCVYATLSPIFPSPSKPGYGPALTPASLRDLALPTWALGGVNATNAGECIAQGAAGAAVMGAVMTAADPATAAAAILSAMKDASLRVLGDPPCERSETDLVP
jgi:thiamine-phosphate pyrophosphorylase